MNNDKPALREKTDAIVEWLLYSWHKRYVTLAAIQQGTNLPRRDISNAVRTLATTYKVLKYTNRGEYEILDLERYFDEPEPGCHERWRTPQLYR